MLAFTESTTYSPLNTVIDADRDYRDLTGLGGCGCAGGCASCGDIGSLDEGIPTALWLVPTLLLGLLYLPGIVSSFYPEDRRQGW